MRGNLSQQHSRCKALRRIGDVPVSLKPASQNLHRSYFFVARVIRYSIRTQLS